MNGFQFPWERLTAAAKAGFPERLVTYNAGIGKPFLYTRHQDYWAGEMVNSVELLGRVRRNLAAIGNR